MRCTTLSGAPIAYKFEASPSAERVPSVPRQTNSPKSWPNHPPPDFIRVDRKPVTGVKNDTGFRITYGPAVFV